MVHEVQVEPVPLTNGNNVTAEWVKESLNRPGVAQRVPGDLDSQIFMTFGT